MKLLNFKMTVVSSCNAAQCAYNNSGNCCAKAITIGDFQDPNCDTFFSSLLHCERLAEAGVGACKVSGCKYNQEFECTADDIKVGKSRGSVKCLSYQQL